MWELKPPILTPPEFEPNQVPLFIESAERNDPIEPNPRNLNYKPPAEFPLNPQTQALIKRLNLLSFKYKNLLYNLELSSLDKDNTQIENDEEIELDDLEDSNGKNNNVGVSPHQIHHVTEPQEEEELALSDDMDLKEQGFKFNFSNANTESTNLNTNQEGNQAGSKLSFSFSFKPANEESNISSNESLNKDEDETSPSAAEKVENTQKRTENSINEAGAWDDLEIDLDQIDKKLKV